MNLAVQLILCLIQNQAYITYSNSVDKYFFVEIQNWFVIPIDHMRRQPLPVELKHPVYNIKMDTIGSHRSFLPEVSRPWGVSFLSNRSALVCVCFHVNLCKNEVKYHLCARLMMERL